MAVTEPVVLAFEDLQWADSGLLDFIDYLLEWSADHPIFVLALGRQELETRRPNWGTSLRLHPLSPEAMRALLDGLVPSLPFDLAERILARAEGVMGGAGRSATGPERRELMIPTACPDDR